MRRWRDSAPRGVPLAAWSCGGHDIGFGPGVCQSAFAPAGLVGNIRGGGLAPECPGQPIPRLQHLRSKLGGAPVVGLGKARQPLAPPRCGDQIGGITKPVRSDLAVTGFLTQPQRIAMARLDFE